MAVRLSQEWLDSLGVEGLDSGEANHALATVRTKLESAVGQRIAAQMSSEQLHTFEEFVDRGTPEAQAEAIAWLSDNVPDYSDVVAEEFADFGSAIAADPEGFAAMVRASYRKANA